MPFKYKRGDIWYIGFTPKEKQLGFKPFSTGLKNGRNVEDRIAELRKEIKQKKKAGQFNPIASEKLSEMFAAYCQEKKDEGREYNRKTLEGYNQMLDRLYDVVGDKPVREYTELDCTRFYADLDRTCKHNGKAAHSHRIYAIFNWLKKKKRVPENPFKRVNEKDKEFTVLTRDEVRQILEFAKSKNPDRYHFVKFGILSAFRLTEIINLRWGDIKANHIRVFGKGSKHAQIPIIKPMRDYLNTLQRGAADEKVIKINTSSQAYRFWQSVSAPIDKGGLGITATTHDLRKFCLSEMANSGVKINFVKEYARHNDIKTTLKYYIEADLKRMKTDIDNKIDFDFETDEGTGLSV